MAVEGLRLQLAADSCLRISSFVCSVFALSWLMVHFHLV